MRRTLSLGVPLAMAATGCGGARSAIKADTSSYPISLSDGLRNADGSLVSDDQVRSVGTFKASFTDWSALWMFVPFRQTHDISDEVNAQVAQAGGNAINDLAITTSHCAWNNFTVLGLLPDCAHVDLEGNILKVSPRKKP